MNDGHTHITSNNSNTCNDESAYLFRMNHLECIFIARSGVTYEIINSIDAMSATGVILRRKGHVKATVVVKLVGFIGIET